MFMLNSNDPIEVALLQKLANQSVLNCTLVIEMVDNSFSEIKKNFGRLIKWGMFLWRKKNEIWAVKNTFLLDFANSLFRSEKRNLLMFRSDFSRWGVRSKSIIKMPYGNQFLISQCIFKLVCHCESCRWSEICCV